MQNGMPCWYFHAARRRAGRRRCKSVDPSGRIAADDPAAQVIGCVVYPGAEIVAPGVVKHIEGDRFPVGELDGGRASA